MNIEPDKLKSLVKDENSYSELMNLISADSTNEHFFNNHNDFFSIIRNRGEHKNIRISDSVQSVLGYEPSEIETMAGGILALVYTDDMEKVKKAITEFETDPKRNSTTLTFRVSDKNQKVKWIKESVSVERDEHGRVSNQFSVICDITEVKNVEDKLKTENEKLLEINNTKDRFISIVSHDLRAPFTSLLGFSEILLSEKGLPEEEKNEYLNYIYDASKNQLQLINYLLEWSRLQTGRVIPEIRRLNLRMLVSNCISSLIGNAIRKDIELKQDIENNIFIQADEKLITQAISNLISNAIKFTPKYKSVTISANNFKEGMIEVVVKDEGVGISEKDQDKVFKIDQKFSLKGTEGEKGSGLGLTLVKEIIDRHKGDIWFYSQENEGTEFHLILPEAKNVILLVEDDESLMGLYRKAVEKDFAGFEIIQSKNGYEAMSIVMNALPTIVVTDHDMPLMNGVQLVEAIRKKDKKNSVPVLVISAKLNDKLKEKYNSLGVLHILDKPVSPENLIIKMKEVVD